MATQPMTKFVALNVATARPCLYLKSPSDEQLEAVLAWLDSKGLDMQSCQEATAVFTKTGKGKPAPAIAIEFTSVDPAAAKQMAELYPAPKSLDGVKLTDHDVLDPVSDMPIAPMDDLESAQLKQPEPGEVRQILEEAGCLPAHAIQAQAPGHVSQAEVMEGTSDLIAIGATGPLPSDTPVNPDGVPF